MGEVGVYKKIYEYLFDLGFLEPADDFLNVEKYTKSCKTSITNAFTVLFNNPQLYYDKTLVMNLNFSTLQIDKIEYVNNIQNEFFRSIMVSSTQEGISVSLPSLEVLKDHIKQNKKHNFIFISILLHDHINQKTNPTHVGCLIIDNKEKKIYCFDPNGTTDTFSNKKNQNYFPNSLDYVFINYFSDLDYDYIPSTELTDGKQINEIYYLPFDKGTCVSWTILFGFLVKKLELCPKDLYKTLSGLNKEQRGDLIYAFINNFMDLL